MPAAIKVTPEVPGRELVVRAMAAWMVITALTMPGRQSP
jgi:hypothetical protein